MTSIQEIADRLDLYRSGNHWRGECPACRYGTPTLLVKEWRSRIRFVCVSCGDKDQIAAALYAVGVGERLDRDADSPAADKATDGRRKATERAVALWRGSEPVTPDDAAGRYLRRRRLGFAIGNPSLRFRCDMPHPNRGKYPALVCRIDDPAGELVAIQRVYLDREGRKADVDPVKACKGPAWTGAIRFGTGPEIVVAEGPETALAAGQLLGLPAWSAINSGNFGKGLILPPEVRRVVIAADHDLQNPRTGRRAGIEAADAAAQRWRAEGRTARVMIPDREGEDFADVLAHRAGRVA